MIKYRIWWAVPTLRKLRRLTKREVVRVEQARQIAASVDHRDDETHFVPNRVDDPERSHRQFSNIITAELRDARPAARKSGQAARCLDNLSSQACGISRGVSFDELGNCLKVV
jgi:hypothetical protein